VEAAVKPARFEYEAPYTLDEALILLDEESRPLAGGQSLMPLLNFRLARPEKLVDLNRIDELAYLRRRDGSLHIGALTRQAVLERSRLVAERWPLLTETMPHVGHPQVRTRGTVGGSVAFAEPSAELPVALTALDARFHLRSSGNARLLTAAELFVGPLMTALEPDELLVEIEVPPLPEGARTAFAEYAETHGDFAIAGAAVVTAPGHAAIALMGAASKPVRAAEAERALAAGAEPAHVAELAAELAPAGHRRALVAALVREALERAAS
jgi:CO/xanthine dehydrogenase FAD-binding subunit